MYRDPKWKNFATVCAWCEQEGRPALLKPLEHCPEMKVFTISHGMCRFHALEGKYKGDALSDVEKIEYFALKIKRDAQDAINLFRNFTEC